MPGSLETQGVEYVGHHSPRRDTEMGWPCLWLLAGRGWGYNKYFLFQLKTSGLLIDNEMSAYTVILSGKEKGVRYNLPHTKKLISP